MANITGLNRVQTAEAASRWFVSDSVVFKLTFHKENIVLFGN